MINYLQIKFCPITIFTKQITVCKKSFRKKYSFKFFKNLLFSTASLNRQKRQLQRKSWQSIQSRTSTVADLQVPIYVIAMFENDTWPVTVNTGIKKSLNKQPQNIVHTIQRTCKKLKKLLCLTIATLNNSRLNANKKQYLYSVVSFLSVFKNSLPSDHLLTVALPV